MGTYPNQRDNKPIYNEFITPVGKFTRLYHEEPQLKTDYNTKQPVFDKSGIQIAHYKVSIVFPKSIADMETHPLIPGSPGLLPLRRLAFQTKGEAWPEALNPATANWIITEPFLYDGDNPQHNTERKEFLFGHLWMNIKQTAKYKKVPCTPSQEFPQGYRIEYEGKPGLLGPYGVNGPVPSPLDIWPGCEGRVSGVMFGTEFAGKKYIKLLLNNIQLYREGERMFGGSRPDAAKQFDPLMQGSPPLSNQGMFNGQFNGQPTGGLVDPFGQFGGRVTY